MSQSTQTVVPSATPAQPYRQLGSRFQHELVKRIDAFTAAPVTPTSFAAFEQDLQALLQGYGRTVLETTLNRLEPEPLPGQAHHDGEYYRLRPKSPRRRLASLFGPVRLWRYRYEALTPGESAWFPLEQRLGLEAQRATPALAERVAWWSVGQTQAQVLAILRRDHAVGWSVATLRTVTQSLSAGMAEHRHATQVAQLHAWLQQAQAAGGPHRPVLSVSRDGVMVPIRHETEYREAAAGTVSVIDGHGQRLGTVFLGQMPEPGQKTLSRQMTRLVTGVLLALAGAAVRLHYVSDGGYEPNRYYQQVLRKLVDPCRRGRRLVWTRVIDFYHACGYVTKMSEALCGVVAMRSWATKMRRWLRDKRNGVYRVLHSAAALRSRSRRRWTEAELQRYREGYGYLRKRKAFMDYAAYRARGLPIGSGIVEAACKTVFTQRLKQSGMTWGIDGGQVIIDLRTIWLSGVWREVHAAYLAAKLVPKSATQRGKRCKPVAKAA